MKEFATAALNSGHETFIVHVTSLENLSNTQEADVYLFRKAQIAVFMANKAPTSIPTKYSDFANVFSPELASKLPKHTGINDYAIKLVDD